MELARKIAKIEAETFSDAWSEESVHSTLSGSCNYVIYYCDSKATVFSDEKDAGEISGYILYSLVCGEAELLRIAVDSSMRKKGIANTMMEVFFSELKKNACEKIFLEVEDENVPAIKLYEKFHFKEIHRRKNYYQGHDAIIMQCELD